MDHPHQITVGFKVTAQQKHDIEAAAKRLDTDVSAYLRSLLLPGHEKVKRFLHLPDEVLVAPQQVQEAIEAITVLRGKYPKRSPSDLLLAALKMAAASEDLLVSIKIKKFLP